MESRCVLATSYLAADLVSDQPGVAPIQDPHLVNAWGIALGPTTGAFWVASNGADLADLFLGDVGGGPLVKATLEVGIPGGAPTGVAFNGTTDFVVTSGPASAPAIFIFASLSGAVTGWHPAVPPPPPATSAQPAFQAIDGAVYTGLALANNGSGNFLYLADFHNGKIDVLSASFQLTSLAGSFTDPNLPDGYAPFNVAAIGGKLLVAYAKQDPDAASGVAEHQRGFINVFDLNGNFEQRLVSKGKLDAPWAMVVAPAGFGDFGGDLLVGNFGDGRINAYDPTTGAFQGTLSQSPGRAIEIDGLWGLAFGNGVSAGDATTLYYAAGPEAETQGLFGKITANPEGTNPVQATLDGADLVITGSRNDDHVQVTLRKKSQEIVVRAGGEQIGTFALAAVGTIRFDGLAGDDRIQIADEITVTTILDGGAGDDRLLGGRGNNVLLGGSGEDLLLGSVGRDILIGGTDRDLVIGRGGDDLLIGGSTAHDNNEAALLQILAEWTSSESYETRIANLRSGAGGLPILDATTVPDDAARDVLHGGNSLDWYFAGDADLLPGKRATEQVN
ncbi:MAG: TIGR03118 family protein [Planctomycetaceae bacterium]|nr:TIGR03118 family protein [Planctomycetaceae bacterium]